MVRAAPKRGTMNRRDLTKQTRQLPHLPLLLSEQDNVTQGMSCTDTAVSYCGSSGFKSRCNQVILSLFFLSALLK